MNIYALSNYHYEYFYAAEGCKTWWQHNSFEFSTMKIPKWFSSNSGQSKHFVRNLPASGHLKHWNLINNIKISNIKTLILRQEQHFVFSSEDASPMTEGKKNQKNQKNQKETNRKSMSHMASTYISYSKDFSWFLSLLQRKSDWFCDCSCDFYIYIGLHLLLSFF